MTANIAIKSELSVILPIFFSIFCRAKPNLHFLSVARKKTEAKERARKRPELRGRNTNSSNHSMNSLRSNSISAIRDSILIQRICIPLKTSSCGMFSRSCATRKHEAQVRLRLCRLASPRTFSSGGWGLPPLRKKMANPVGGVAPGRAKAREPCSFIGCAMSSGSSNYRKRK